MTSSEKVLCVNRSDRNGTLVYLYVSSNNAPHLHLQATDGDAAYASDITTSQISNLREQRSPQLEVEWENTFLNTLLQRPTGSGDPSEQIEAVASVSFPRLTITFRKNISGITQRLGHLTLNQDDNLELDTLSWIPIAISRADALEAEVAALTVKHASAQQTILVLNQQLEELITAKQAHEKALLSKFKDLLNAKKVKIRDQQRLLAQANIQGPLQREQAAKRGANGAAAHAGPAATAPGARGSKRRKRGANDAGLKLGGKDSEEEEEEAAFEGPAFSMRVKDEDGGEDEDRVAETPGGSDSDVTEDEDEEEQGAESDNRDRDGGASEESERMQVDKEPPSLGDLPPDRELPFEKAAVKVRNGTVQKEQKNVPEEEQETDDDDDEL